MVSQEWSVSTLRKLTPIPTAVGQEGLVPSQTPAQPF